jgi:hypothetical protein
MSSPHQVGNTGHPLCFNVTLAASPDDASPVMENPTPADTIVISVDDVFAKIIFQLTLLAVPFVLRQADVTKS